MEEPRPLDLDTPPLLVQNMTVNPLHRRWVVWHSQGRLQYNPAPSIAQSGLLNKRQIKQVGFALNLIFSALGKWAQPNRHGSPAGVAPPALLPLAERLRSFTTLVSGGETEAE